MLIDHSVESSVLIYVLLDTLIPSNLFCFPSNTVNVLD